MAILTTLLGGAALSKGVQTVGKAILKTTVGADITRASMHTFRSHKLINVLPFLGPLKMLRDIPRAFKSGMKDWSTVVKATDVVARRASTAKDLSSVLRRELPANMQRHVSNITGQVYKNYSQYVTGRSRLGGSFNVKEQLRVALGKVGFEPTEKLMGAVEGGTQAGLNAAEHARSAKGLFFKRLAANTAVVGLPGLTSSLWTGAIVRSVRRKTGNRYRGYSEY